MQLVMHEVQMLGKIDHKNCVKLLDFNDNGVMKASNGAQKNVFYMALELCQGGELFDFIAQTGRFEEHVA